MTTERIDVVITERGAPVVKRSIEDIGRQAVNSQRNVDLLGRAFQTLVGYLSIREFVRLNDTYTEMSNRLRLVSTDTANLSRLTSELFDVANRTRSSFEATATLYARVALSTKQLGYSQQELINFVEGVNNATILSGVSAREATAAMIQFSQGLAKGRLDGDELRSVLEQLPFVADVIGQHLKANRFELKELGKQGKLTPAVIIEAFQAMEGQLAPMVARLGFTFSQAWVLIENQVMQRLGPLSEQIGSGLGVALAFLADNFDILTSAVSSLIPLMAALAGRAAIGAVIAGFAALTTWIMANPFTFLIGAIGGAIVAYGQFDDEMDEVLKGMGRQATMIDRLAATWAGFRAYVEAAWEDFPQWFEGVMQWAMDLALKQFARLADFIPNTLRSMGESIAKHQESNLVNGDFARNLFNSMASEFKTGDEILADVGARRDHALLNPDSLKKAGDAYTEAYRDTLLSLSKPLGELAGAGPNTAGDTGGGKGKKGKTFAQIQEELIQQIELMSLTRDERERGNEVMKIESELKRKLSSDEAFIIHNMLQTLQNLERQNKLYEEIRLPAENYRKDTEALGVIFRNNAITAEEYNRKLLELQVALLETDTTIQGGIIRGVTKLQLEFGNLSDVAENLVVNSIRSAEDAFVKFVSTGKAEISDLVNSMIADFARLAIRQTVTAPLMGIAGQFLAGLGGGGDGLGLQGIGTVPPGTLHGNLAQGGNTISNGFYEVNEHGPEVYTTRGRSYLMTGDDPGRVTPMPQYSGGGSARPIVVNPIIYNNASDKVSANVQASSDGEGNLNIEFTVDSIEQKLAGRVETGNSVLLKSLTRTMGVSPKPRGG